MSILNFAQVNPVTIRFYLGMKVIRKGQTRALVHNGFVRQQHEQNGGEGWMEFRPKSDKAGVVQTWLCMGNQQQEVNLEQLLEIALPGVDVSTIIFVSQIGSSEKLEALLEGNTGVFVEFPLASMQAESDIREAYRGGAEMRIHLIEASVKGSVKPPRKDLISLGEALENALTKLPQKKRGVEGLLARYEEKKANLASTFHSKIQAEAVETVEVESLEDIVL